MPSLQSTLTLNCHLFGPVSGGVRSVVPGVVRPFSATIIRGNCATLLYGEMEVPEEGARVIAVRSRLFFFYVFRVNFR